MRPTPIKASMPFLITPQRRLSMPECPNKNGTLYHVFCELNPRPQNRQYAASSVFVCSCLSSYFHQIKVASPMFLPSQLFISHPASSFQNVLKTLRHYLLLNSKPPVFMSMRDSLFLFECEYGKCLLIDLSVLLSYSSLQCLQLVLHHAGIVL